MHVQHEWQPPLPRNISSMVDWTGEINKSHGAQLTLGDYEYQDPLVKYTISTVSLVFITANILTLVAIKRTKHTPTNGKFLCVSLIMFETTVVVLFTIRKFMPDLDSNATVHTVSRQFILLTYVTVACMAFDRLIYCKSPHMYIRRMAPGQLRRYMAIVWSLLVVIFYVIRYVMCYWFYGTHAILHRQQCMLNANGYHGIVVFISVFTSCASYINILIIVKMKSSVGIPVRFMMNKGTRLLLAYVVGVSTVAVISVMIFSFQLSVCVYRLIMDIVFVVDYLKDSCLYVFWFRESRMHLRKLLLCDKNQIVPMK